MSDNKIPSTVDEMNTISNELGVQKEGEEISKKIKKKDEKLTEETRKAYHKDEIKKENYIEQHIQSNFGNKVKHIIKRTYKNGVIKSSCVGLIKAEGLIDGKPVKNKVLFNRGMKTK